MDEIKNEAKTTAGEERLISTEQGAANIPWLMPANIMPANFGGTKNSQKFILKDNPETVIRIAGFDIHNNYLEDGLKLKEIAFSELGRLRTQFNVHVANCDYRIVHPFVISDRELASNPERMLELQPNAP